MPMMSTSSTSIDWGLSYHGVVSLAIPRLVAGLRELVALVLPTVVAQLLTTRGVAIRLLLVSPLIAFWLKVAASRGLYSKSQRGTPEVAR